MNPDVATESRLPLWLRWLACWPLPALHALGAVAGWLLWRVPNGLRERTLIHLARCFPDWDDDHRRRVAKRSLGHLARAFAESPLLWFGPASRVRALVREVHGSELWESARAQGRGVILLTPHLGSWEMAGLYCADQAPITSLYKPQKSGLDEVIKRGRERFGARLAASDGNGVRALLRGLQRGESIGILPDQDPPRGSGVFAPFFGIAAHTPVLAGRLAARTGAPVLFVVAERLPRGRGFVMRFRAVPAAVADPDPTVVATAVNGAVEALVRALPEQYYWGYARFRRRPPGEMDDWYDKRPGERL